MRNAMCRYMYIYFSNCSHQTFVLLDCCAAADVRTVVNDYAVARKALKTHSRWEQNYLHPASELCPSKNFHKTTQPWREAQDGYEQYVGRPETQKRVGVDEHASRFQGCHPLLSISDDSRDVASDHTIGNAPLSDAHIRPRCRSGDTVTAGTSLPGHLQHPQEMKTAGRSEYLGSKRHSSSREVRSASASTAKSSVNSTLESSVFHLDRDSTEDGASRLQSPNTHKIETGRIHRKMSWAAQGKDELQAGFVPQQPPMLCEACARPRVHELLGEKASVCSCRSVPEAKDRRTRKSESAIHEGQEYSAIHPSPLFRSSHHVKSASDEGLSTYKSGVSNIKLNARVKHDRGTPLEDGLSSSAVDKSVVPGSGSDILSGDKQNRSSSATKQSERSQGAAGTLGLGQSKLSSRREGFTPSEQLLKGNNKAYMSTTSQRTDDKSQSPIRDNTLEEHNVKDQGRARSSATESGPVEMTWAQRIRAGGSKGTTARKPEQKNLGQDAVHNPSASGSSPPRSGFRWGPSRGLSVASVSDFLQVSSPPAEKRAFPTVSSTSAQTSPSDGLRTSQSNGSLSGAVHQATFTLGSSNEQGQRATRSIQRAQKISRSSDKTARITSPDEGSDENLRKSFQRLASPTLDEMHVQEDDGYEWHVVTRKNRVPQTARPSKSIRRKTKALKRLSQSTPAALAPVQKAASCLPTPKISPSFPPLSSFSPSSESMSTLLKPSYATVASLRSPVISMSSSTTSSADAPFISAPQSPEHNKSASDIVLGSPESSETYFSAPEDSEDVLQIPTRECTLEGHSVSWETPAAVVLTETDKVSTNLARASRDAYDKETLAAKDIGPRSPKPMENGTMLGWTDQDRSIIRLQHSSELFLRESAAESLGVPDPSRGRERKPLNGSSSNPAGTSNKHIRGGSSNAQEHPTLSYNDGRFSEPSDPSAGPMAVKKLPAEETGGSRNRSETTGSHRNGSEDKPTMSTRGNKSYLQEVDNRLTKDAFPAPEASAAAPAPRASTHKPSTRSQKLANTKHNSKPDASSRITATPSSPQTAEGPQISSLPLPASPPNVVPSPQSPNRVSTPAPSQDSTQDFPSEPPRRGRAGSRVTHDAATGLNTPREDSILRGEAPAFTPHTTPSKSRGSTFQSPASLATHVPESTVQPPDLDYAAFALQYTPTALQPLPGVRDKGKKSILTPWMSRDFWLPKNAVARARVTQCVLGRKDRRSEPREQTAAALDIPGRLGQIRRLKPCGFIQVEQAVEQIGMWCPRCSPD